MAEESKSILPHLLLFPFPIPGHMPPMLNLAQALLSSSSSDDLLITFVNTEHSHHRFSLHSPLLLHLLEQHPNFRFRTIPDGLPRDDPRPFQQFMQLEESLRTRSREDYKELLVSTGDGWPQVTCVVADAVLTLAMEVAEEEGIPVMIFRTSSACSFWVFRCVGELVLKGEIPFPENADLDELVQGVEGTESFLRRRDLPSFCRDAKSPSDPRLQILRRITDNASRARALIMNTFQALEAPMLSRIRTFCPIVYSIGPIHVLARNLCSSSVVKNQVSLWQQDRKCMAWLGAQPPKSVVYVSFGSIALMSREEMIELWHGLINSGHRFLWVVRQDHLVPQELGASSTMWCMVRWAPQEEVLAHPSVGCFLTHSGWNSTMESIAAGVPMICWPFMTDQQINSRFVSEVWKVGLDMKDEGGRSVIEKMVRDVMEGKKEKAEEARRSVGEMAAEARASVEEEGGSSYLNFQHLIQHIKSLSSKKSI